MFLRSHYPYWLLKNGYVFAYPSLDENVSTDILIIGAGVSGALIGYTLSRLGFQVTLVDKRMPASGSTCASTSLVQYEIDKSLVDLSLQLGAEKASAAYLICVNSIDKLRRISETLSIDSEFENKKSLYIATKKGEEKKLQEECNARKKIGIHVDYLDQGELYKNFSLKAHGALLSQAGAQMDCFRFTQGLLQYIKMKGGKVYGHTEIKKIGNEKNGMELLTDNKKKIKAGKVIFATGYESLLYIDPPLTTLHTTYAVASETMNTRPLDYLLWETSRPYFYLRSTKDNRIIIGGKDEVFSNSTGVPELIRKKSAALTRTFQKMYPSIKFKPDFEWSGTFADTADGLPYIGTHPRFPHAFFILGFGGNGITFSQVAADLIKDLILKKKNRYASIFSFSR